MRLVLSAVLTVLACPVAALASPNAACWYRDLEQIDAVTSPPQGGDNEFFTASDIPPNVMWVLDSSGSMQALPCDTSCGTYANCGGVDAYGSEFFLSRGYPGYSGDADAFPAFDADFCATAGNDRAYSGRDGCYKPGLVYSLPTSCTSWPSSGRIWTTAGATESGSTIESWCASTYPAETPPQPGASCSSDLACAAGYRCLTSSGATTGSGRRCRIPNDCRTAPLYTCPESYACSASSGRCERFVERDACVASLHDRGYDPNGSADPVFTGDALNYYPPKFVVARRVVKDLVASLKKTRQGLMVFDTDGVSGSDGNGGRLLNEFGPTCDRFRTSGGSAVVPNDAEFRTNASAVNARIDGVKFISGTPLAETLSSACQYLSGSQTRFRDQVKVNGSNGVGAYDNDIPSRSGNADPVCFSCQKSFVVVITDGDPSIDENVPCKLRNYDRDCKEGLQKSPSCGSVSTGVCPSSERRTYAQSGGTDYFDDVANFCFAEDLRPDLSDKQNAVVHTVGFGIRAPILEDAAEKGGGLLRYADDAEELRNALAAVVTEVNKRATSFSVASVTTVQTRGSTYAFVPRFRPAADDLWEGHLYRFKLFNEFAAGCTIDDTDGEMTEAKRARNPNGDGDCDDVYLQDANNDFVQENADGEYMLADTSQSWSDATGWPLRSPAKPAVPVWDATDALQSRNLKSDPRIIHTVVDANGDGVHAPSEQLAFTVANVDALLPALALGGVSGPFCTAFAARLGKAFGSERDCAIDLIQFVRGVDVADEDRDGKRDDARPKILGDVFHSSPILVTSPVAPYLCDLGVASQCAFSLYSPRLTPGGAEAYAEWVDAAKERSQLVLVGANDGMLHAFHAGDWGNGDDPDTDTEEKRWLDLGSGRELWAFIPPDMLPKLRRLAVRDGRHELLVDGTAMVRDVWVDATNPGTKEASEFHTLAIVGERQGGRSWFALDVSSPAAPSFRWIYPPVGTSEALEAGESWNDFAPAPPPIGPVAVADPGGPLTVGEVRASERWAVFLGGGYDAALVRGRSMTALDAWSGAPMWRFAASDADGAGDPRASLFPVAAPVSLLDLGPLPRTQGVQDGLFDTAVVGDVMGQVWAVRLHAPGADTDGDGLFDNWHAGRAFTEFAGDPLARRNPFFQLAEATIGQSDGVVRVHLGSGDRANIRDRDGGDCGLLNLGACIRKGCDVTVTPASVHNGAHFVEAELASSGGSAGFARNTLLVDGLAPTLACTDPTKVEITTTLQCGGATSGAWTTRLACDWDDADGSLCSVSDSRPEPLLATLQVTASTENARFYTFELFSPERAPFTSASEAATYDGAALSDVDLADAEAGALDPHGWYVPYPRQDERTSSAATVLGGCVLWNTLKPDLTPLACGARVEDEARLYRADVATGAPRCGAASTNVRSVVRKSIVPPPAPTPVVSFNARTGEVRYSVLAVEPGVPPAQTTVGVGELAGSIYWLEVPREVHACRHGDGECR